ncbi:uncharacterized protein LOC120266541 isoform X2 [Dioscorea cayenensis subsp. rotundata]|uniref:Uncharacterized protein LOC120266541 isoform X2 n=1 Tax=Dioscorea cayennensis subsp. rotundata TaxID=55577 RepID=A0AB40BRR4_DIOCR|nr:uncharacterized protein LOC120266541 isoform X2 [Dioscorea cayenensis subsp. rotundata]
MDDMGTKFQSQLPLNYFNNCNQHQDSMDTSLEKNHSNKETMKNIILKHEEMFKHQVHELHRLYRIQKTLMKDLLNKESRDTRACFPGFKVGVEDSLTDEEENELELTLSIGCAANKKKSKLITGRFCFH